MKRYYLLYMLGSLVTLFLSLTEMACSPGKASWQIETVDSGLGAQDGHVSLAIDVKGFPHISYYDRTNRDLKYAWYGGTSWQIETVDATGGTRASLVLDVAGNPHISYASGNSLKYAYYDGSTWQIEIVDDCRRCGCWYVSLTLDTVGHPYISYVDSPVDDQGHCYHDSLKYAHYDGHIWQVDTVDKIGRYGGPASSALDMTGRPHVCYYVSSDDTLKCAYHDNGVWIIDIADRDVRGGSLSLALNSAGQPHIGYRSYHGYDHSLKYVYFDGDMWHTEIVDTNDVRLGSLSPPSFVSLALDAAEYPHISYNYLEAALGAFGFSTDYVRYAYYDGERWQVETVDKVGNLGRSLSLALDFSGHPHISYWTQVNFNFLRECAKNWNMCC